MSTSPARPVLTPCIKVCAVDGESGLCLGCFRSLQEITAWARYTDDERAIILDQLSARRQLISPEKLGLPAWPSARAN